MSARRKGANLTPEIIDRIAGQLAGNLVATVNLGGNEPLFTNGPKPADTLLPYIVDRLNSHGMDIGLTTSGITLRYLSSNHPEALLKLNDVDVSLDSPYAGEHNANRGAALFGGALRALEICKDAGIPRTIVMCAMNWNFDRERLAALIDLARRYDANVRINALKPVEAKHMSATLSPAQYYEGFRYLMEKCETVDLGEPPLAAVSKNSEGRRCPCGRTSFRIHSITPDGRVHVSPCVYLHDYKSSADLLTTDLDDILISPEFMVFRRRHANPELVEGCSGCSLRGSCGGGCAARAYLYGIHSGQKPSMFNRDPFCPRDHAGPREFPRLPSVERRVNLVHMDYLCTWIGVPR